MQLREQAAKLLPKPKRTPGVPVEEEAPIYAEVVADEPIVDPEKQGYRICGRTDFDPSRWTCRTYIAVTSGWKKFWDKFDRVNQDMTFALQDWGEDVCHWLDDRQMDLGFWWDNNVAAKLPDFDLEAMMRYTNSAVVWSQYVARGWKKRYKEVIRPWEEERDRKAAAAEQRQWEDHFATRGDLKLHFEAFRGTLNYELGGMVEQLEKSGNKDRQMLERQLKAICKAIRVINKRLSIDDNDPDSKLPPEAAGMALGTPYYYGEDAYLNEAAGDVAAEEAPSVEPPTIEEVLRMFEQVVTPGTQPSKTQKMLRKFTGCNQSEAKMALRGLRGILKEAKYPLAADLADDAA